MKKIFLQIKDAFVSNNPVLIQLLGLCSALAVTTNLSDAFGMGIAVTAVLICSNVFISALRKIIPSQIRIAAYIVVISGFVTAAELLIKAYLPSLDASLGIFIPLIVVNCVILARAEAFASKNGIFASAFDGLAMGLGYTFAVCTIGVVREVLGSGRVLGFDLGFNGAGFFTTAAGGFLVMGLVLAVVNALTRKGGKK